MQTGSFRNIPAIVAVVMLLCLCGLPPRAAQAGESPYICNLCVNECKEWHGKQLIDCWKTCEPKCGSVGAAVLPDGAGGGILGAGISIGYKCAICKDNCQVAPDKYKCLSECSLICSSNFP